MSTTVAGRRVQRPNSLTPRVKVWLEVDSRYAFGLGIAEILQAVEQTGSIKQAARFRGRSYRHVWGRIREAEKALGRRLVLTQVGGHGARRSSLTPDARQLVDHFLAFRGRMFQLLQHEFRVAFA